jgi:galactose mutarotase-like enzyme
MRAKVYIESSVISYLASRPSRDLIVAARQAVTAEWWDHRRSRFDLYVSALVEEEISKGDPAAAAKRLEIVRDIPALDISEGAKALAKRLLERGAVPVRSEEDALHIAVAAAAGMSYLLTWNFKHINNAETKEQIMEVVESHGFVCPTLCSPEELGL